MPRCLMSDTFARSLKTINILFHKFLILFQGGKHLKAIPISYRLCPCPSPVGWVAPSSVTSRARLNPALPNPVWTYTHVCIGVELSPAPSKHVPRTACIGARLTQQLLGLKWSFHQQIVPLNPGLIVVVSCAVR